MTTKNSTPAVPSGGNSGGAHTVGEVMELAREYARGYAYSFVCEPSNPQLVKLADAAHEALLAAITKLVDERDCDRAILLARIVAMENARLEMNPDWDVKSACMQSVREHMEIAADLREKLERMENERNDLLAAIEKLVSDRDVLLSAMTTLSTAQQSVLLLEYVHGVARAAIQKVTK